MWTVVFADEFQEEFDRLSTEVQDEFLAQALWIEQFGPEAGRRRVDTLKGSAYANMKELRFEADNGSGELRSPSIRSAEQSCWSQQTSRE